MSAIRCRRNSPQGWGRVILKFKIPTWYESVGIVLALLAVWGQSVAVFEDYNQFSQYEFVWGLTWIPTVVFLTALLSALIARRVIAVMLYLVGVLIAIFSIFNVSWADSDWIAYFFSRTFSLDLFGRNCDPDLGCTISNFSAGNSVGLFFAVAFLGLALINLGNFRNNRALIEIDGLSLKPRVIIDRRETTDAETASSLARSTSLQNSTYLPNTGMSVAALICALVIPWIGLILAYVARNDIRRSGGRLGGEGLVKAALIIGWICLVLQLWVLVILVAIVGSSLS